MNLSGPCMLLFGLPALLVVLAILAYAFFPRLTGSGPSAPTTGREGP